MTPMDRRRFLKVTAITGTTAALTACGNPEHQIVRFIPDEEIVPGVAEWRPSICPLCAAGCGVQARVMDGDAEVIRNGTAGLMRMPLVKKLEGDPAQPAPRPADFPALVEAIRGAADALDMIGRDPLSEALTRLRESAEAAKSRLQAGRMLASGILADALAGFVTFEGEMGAEEVLEVPTIALPPVEVVEPAEQVTATAANAVAEAAPVAPLAPVEEFPPTPEELADAEAPLFLLDATLPLPYLLCYAGLIAGQSEATTGRPGLRYSRFPASP